MLLQVRGGVGKTTTSASLAMGLAKKGHRSAVIDFDVGLRNLDLVMGCERRVVFDLINVINGECSLNQALIRDKRTNNLCVLPTSQTRDKMALTKEGVGQVLAELSEGFEYIVCDSPAGIERGATMAMYYADDAIVVTNPEISSIRDSDRMLGILASKSRRAENSDEPIREYLLLSRYSPERVEQSEMLHVEDVQEILSLDLLGVVPESKSVLTAWNAGIPVILDEESDAGMAYNDVVERYLGEKLPHRFLEVQKKGLFGRLFGG